MSVKLEKGFTLVETIIYIAIFTVIFLAVIFFLYWSIRTHAKEKVMSETLESAQSALDRMEREVREARGVYTPTTTGDQLSLETRKYLMEGEETSYIDFFLCGERVCLKKEGLSPIPLTSQAVRVTSLSFRTVGSTPPSVVVDINIEYENPEGRPEKDFSVDLSTTASLRSY